MGLAIGFTLLHRQAAEIKILCGGVANGPFAGALGQFHQADPLGVVFHFFHLRQGLGADFICRRLRR